MLLRKQLQILTGKDDVRASASAGALRLTLASASLVLQQQDDQHNEMEEHASVSLRAILEEAVHPMPH